MHKIDHAQNVNEYTDSIYPDNRNKRQVQCLLLSFSSR